MKKDINNRTYSFLSKVLLFITSLACVPFALAPILEMRVNGEDGSYFNLIDDAMISMTYAKLLALGEGLSFPSFAPTEGITNPGWVGVMAIAHLIPGDPALYILAVNYGLLLATLFMIYKSVVYLCGNTTFAFLAVITYSLWNGFQVFQWAASGLEASALGFLYMAFVYTIIAQRHQADSSQWPLRAFVVLAALGVAATVVRLDSGLPLFVALIGLMIHSLAYQGLRRRTLYAFGLTLAAIALAALTILALQNLIWGNFLPNTYFLKATGWPGLMRQYVGARYTGYFIRSIILIIPFAFIGFLFLLRKYSSVFVTFSSICVTTVAYTVFIGGDTFDGSRNYLPIMSMIAIGVGLGLKSTSDFVTRKSWNPSLGQIILTIAILFAMVLPPLAIGKVSSRVVNTFQAFHNMGSTDRSPTFWTAELGKALSRGVPPNTKIGVFWAGAIPYFSNLQPVDFLGKLDSHIANLPVDPLKGLISGHNKWDFDHSLSMRPEIVISNSRGPRSIAAGVSTLPQLIAPKDLTGDYSFTNDFLANQQVRMTYLICTDRFGPIILVRRGSNILNSSFCKDSTLKSMPWPAMAVEKSNIIAPDP